jgi:hypothetical protein
MIVSGRVTVGGQDGGQEESAAGGTRASQDDAQLGDIELCITFRHLGVILKRNASSTLNHDSRDLAVKTECRRAMCNLWNH